MVVTKTGLKRAEWRRKAGGGGRVGGRRVCSAGRGARGRRREGAGGSGAIGGSGSARPPGIRNPSCCGQTEGEGRTGSETPLPPPRESSADKSFKQTALNWNCRAFTQRRGRRPSPLGAKVFFVGYFWGWGKLG